MTWWSSVCEGGGPPGGDTIVDKRAAVLGYLRALPTKDFAQLFYEATRDRVTSDWPEQRGHFLARRRVFRR